MKRGYLFSGCKIFGHFEKKATNIAVDNGYKHTYATFSKILLGED